MSILTKSDAREPFVPCMRSGDVPPHLRVKNLERNIAEAWADAVERNALVRQILLVVAVVIHIEVQERQVGENDLAA